MQEVKIKSLIGAVLVVSVALALASPAAADPSCLETYEDCVAAAGRMLQQCEDGANGFWEFFACETMFDVNLVLCRIESLTNCALPI